MNGADRAAGEALELQVDVVAAGVGGPDLLTGGRGELQRREDVPGSCFAVFAGRWRSSVLLGVVREVPERRAESGGAPRATRCWLSC